MRITEAVEKADALYPNHYTRQQKLDWCYEVTQAIAQSINKIYDSFTMPGGQEEYFLPSGVLLEDVRYIYIDGKKYTKVDERSFWARIPKNAKEIKVVYKRSWAPYRDIKLEGSYVFGTDRITIPEHAFQVGDYLNVTVDGNMVDCNVLEIDGDEVVVADDTFTAGTKQATIELVLLDETIPPPPYDAMYIDYLIGKIGYYQNDMAEYNKQMTAYNDKLYDYARWYKQTNPLDQSLRFVNKW